MILVTELLLIIVFCLVVEKKVVIKRPFGYLVYFLEVGNKQQANRKVWTHLEALSGF